MAPKIFFSVGEPSGDLHGANLIRQLRAQGHGVQCVGFGGPLMQEAGCEIHEDLTKLAIMWVTRVIANLPKFLRLLKQADQYFERERPDAVVLIDYPGFNWHVARKAKERGIPVFFYGAPQIWAWATWRVAKMRRYIDHVLCKLPFEEPWFRDRGCNATHIGHPFFDETAKRVLDAAFLRQQSIDRRRLITILPGSRKQEVQTNLPIFTKVAEKIAAAESNVRFAIASFNETQADMARAITSQSDIPYDVFVGRTPELMSLAHSCLACSGSVSLELLFHEKPTVIYYRIARWLYTLGRYFMVNTRFVTLVNILASSDPFNRKRGPYDPNSNDADECPFPEYATYTDESDRLAGHLLNWLRTPQSHEKVKQRLKKLKNEVAIPGASERGANYILNAIAKAQSKASLEFSEVRKAA